MPRSDPPHVEVLDWDQWPTRFLFFTGKGGVGKTTIAAATAVRLADTGEPVLLVSTDPASNLADILDAPTGDRDPVPVAAVPRLEVLDLDPQARRAWLAPWDPTQLSATGDDVTTAASTTPLVPART